MGDDPMENNIEETQTQADAVEGFEPSIWAPKRFVSYSA
jgi:hypothetical protein